MKRHVLSKEQAAAIGTTHCGEVTLPKPVTEKTLGAYWHFRLRDAEKAKVFTVVAQFNVASPKRPDRFAFSIGTMQADFGLN